MCGISWYLVKWSNYTFCMWVCCCFRSQVFRKAVFISSGSLQQILLDLENLPSRARCFCVSRGPWPNQVIKSHNITYYSIIGSSVILNSINWFLLNRTWCFAGCPYDLEFREVRRNSVVLLWAEPLYKGQSEISGYIVEISEGAESEDWTPLTREPVTETHFKVRFVSLWIEVHWVVIHSIDSPFPKNSFFIFHSQWE